MMNTVPIFNKYVRAMKAVGLSIRYPSLARQCVKKVIQFLYSEGNFKLKSLPKISLEQMVDQPHMVLKNFQFREGTVTPYELMVIAALISMMQPVNLLEIGTFDGNTTLQMAANSPANAQVHTIDLPPGEEYTSFPILQEDIKYVKDSKKQHLKFAAKLENKKIIQHFGDSATYNFNRFIQMAPIDFCFIDGGHSYECVKNDTEKALAILSAQGMILWHDFDPNFPGVYSYLCELCEKMPLFHIEGTTLVVKMHEISNL